MLLPNMIKSSSNTSRGRRSSMRLPKPASSCSWSVRTRMSLEGSKSFDNATALRLLLSRLQCVHCASGATTLKLAVTLLMLSLYAHGRVVGGY